MEQEERLVFLRAVAAFRGYSRAFHDGFIEPRLSAARQAFLADHAEHLLLLSELAAENAKVLDLFGESAHLFVGNNTDDNEVEPSQLDESKVASTLRQLAREWSSDGMAEREQSVGRIVDALCRYFPAEVRESTRVIVPGSGLGRLPFELSCFGFDAIGNEFSTHMILASHVMLNVTPGRKVWPIYPYIHSPSHWRSNADQCREVQIPDIWPSEAEQPGKMTMAVGGFEEFANSQDAAGTMHAVATCFFIDAPFNFVNTLAAITNIVQLGGLWVNFGPLHWHSEDMAVDGLEFSLESVTKLVEEAGWSFIEYESAVPATYCSTHPNRMARMIFDCEFWVAKKVR